MEKQRFLQIFFNEPYVIEKWTCISFQYKPSGGRQPLHVTADTEGMLLFVSNFHSSSLVVYSLSDKAEGGISINRRGDLQRGV